MITFFIIPTFRLSFVITNPRLKIFLLEQDLLNKKEYLNSPCSNIFDVFRIVQGLAKIIFLRCVNLFADENTLLYCFSFITCKLITLFLGSV